MYIYIYMLCFYILPTQASKRNQTEVEYVSIMVVILFSGMIGVLHMVNLTSTWLTSSFQSQLPFN